MEEKLAYHWKQFKRWGGHSGMTLTQLEELYTKKQLLVAELIAREGCRCFYCTRNVFVSEKGVPMTAKNSRAMLTLDHIIPYSVDPDQDPFNPDGFHIACQKCNNQRGTRSVEEFLKDPRLIMRREAFERNHNRETKK